jgi:hypothetical protein
MMDFKYHDGLKYLQSPLACTKDDQTKIPRNFNILHDQHGLRELENYSWKKKI